MALFLVGSTGGPNILHTLGQHDRGTKWELVGGKKAKLL